MERSPPATVAAAERIALALDLYREEFARTGVSWEEAQVLATEFLVHMRAQ